MKNIKLLIIFTFAAAFMAFKFSPTVVNSQTGLATPTGFSATDNAYNNKVGLYWDAIRGANLYRVFRNTIDNSATATALGTTPAPFFFDSTATAGQTFFYWVRAENGTVLSSFSSSDTGLRSNTTTQGPVPPLEPPPPVPNTNQLTASKSSLGKALFWDEQLSSTRTVSCGTCHSAGTGGTDARSLVTIFNSKNAGFDNIFNTADDIVGSMGVPLSNADGTYSLSSIYGLRSQVTGRKANSFINAVYSPILFWDGRATGQFRDPITNAVVLNNGAALESQAAGPVTNTTEMGHVGRNWQDAATQITNAKPLALAGNVPTALSTWINGRPYPELFLEVYGTTEVTPARIAMAIATYERTLFSDQTPFDKSAAGITPLSAAEQRGLGTFGAVQCGVCHAGSLFTDNSFRNVGLRPAIEDTGRFQVTANNANLGEFRVPGLRNVGLRTSFNHNGKFGTLEEVVAFYNRGGDFRNEPNFQGGLVRPRNLNAQQQADLVAFLKNSLTDQRVANSLPPFDKPTLYTESSRVPQIVGTGTAGSNGQIPNAMAIEPPIVGNPSFTVAVTNALGGANTVLVINSTDPGTASIPSTGSFTRQTTVLQGNGAGNGFGSISLQIPDNAALVGQTFFGRWYVTDAGAASGFSVSPAFRFTVFGDAVAINRAKPADFDGDGKTDVSISRENGANREWWYQKSSNGAVPAFVFGLPTDRITPSDFTGDGKTDIAVWRPTSGEWFVLRSEDSTFYAFPFGATGDIPIPADFDGDGKSDAAVFRPTGATWFVNKSTGGTIIQQFGTSTDAPIPADYDGDNKVDFAIYRANGANQEWWYQKSSTNTVTALVFGTTGDKAVQGDYTGDGKTDIAVWRPSNGNWYILRSEDLSFFAFPFGANGDVPAPGDYDGDGKTDAAVFRPTGATWFLNRSTAGVQIVGFGTSTDRPLPNAFVP